MRIRQSNEGNSLPLETIAVTVTGWQVAICGASGGTLQRPFGYNPVKKRCDFTEDEKQFLLLHTEC